MRFGRSEKRKEEHRLIFLKKSKYVVFKYILKKRMIKSLFFIW